MGPVLLLVAAIATTVAVGAALVGRPESTVVFRFGVLAAWAAIATLVVALIRVDTSLELVVAHTRPGLGVARRVMGLWGGSEGSLLFFGAVLGTGLAAVTPTSRIGRIAAPAVTATLLWASVAVASPFVVLDVPAIAGTGLSPILEHWAMLIHPPLLYTGFALALVPALLDGDPRAGTVSRAAIAVLTVALALGGRWAYTELGWGGWWAWDPVENAALIPWFLLVVHVHLPPSHTIHRWCSLLLWPAVFAGSAMTRTSLRTSVHAFANADDIGWFLWPLTAAVSVGALVLGARLPRSRRVGNRRILPVGLALFSAVVVALGTYRPFLPGEATDGTFYARYLWPAAIITTLGLGLAPVRSRKTSASSRRRAPLLAGVGGVVALALAAAAGWTLWWQLVHATALGAGLATIPLARDPRQATAHFGLALVLAGALGGTASTQQTFELDPGDQRIVADHTIENIDLSLAGDNPIVITATVRVDDRTLTPSLAVHPDRALRLPEVATTGGIFEDVQVILRSADDDGSMVLTVNVEPLANWVWLGTTLMTVALLAPKRSRSRRTAEAPAPIT